jgi:hypothetical protein
VTARQLLIQQAIELGTRLGLELGLELGIQFGVQFGIQLGKRESLLQVLRLRFSTAVDAKIEDRVWEDSIEQIEAWADRLLSAGTLTELMGT